MSWLKNGTINIIARIWKDVTGRIFNAVLTALATIAVLYLSKPETEIVEVRRQATFEAVRAISRINSEPVNVSISRLEFYTVDIGLTKTPHTVISGTVTNHNCGEGSEEQFIVLLGPRPEGVVDAIMSRTPTPEAKFAGALCLPIRDSGLIVKVEAIDLEHDGEQEIVVTLGSGEAVVASETVIVFRRDGDTWSVITLPDIAEDATAKAASAVKQKAIKSKDGPLDPFVQMVPMRTSGTKTDIEFYYAGNVTFFEEKDLRRSVAYIRVALQGPNDCPRCAHYYYAKAFRLDDAGKKSLIADNDIINGEPFILNIKSTQSERSMMDMREIILNSMTSDGWINYGTFQRPRLK